jgi:transcriptional regulator with XRE-family HTH domain
VDLGTKLRSLRKLRDMTVEELSRRSGVSRSYITNIENGRKTEVVLPDNQWPGGSFGD